MAEQGYGTCAWCDEVATTELYVKGNPRSKHPRFAPVCDRHEKHFTAQGAQSLRSVERDKREGRERSREAFRQLKRRGR